MRREIKDYLIDILDECNYLIKESEILDFDSFIKNEHLKRSFVRSLEVIGEAVKKIPEKIRKKYPNIKWKEMSGMRDKLIHEYFGIDYKVVWETVQKDIKTLKIFIDEILRNIE